MDVFSLATEMPGEMPLSSGQLAHLRAINTRYYLRVYDLLRGPDGHGENRPLTEVEDAEVHTMLVSDILEILSPEQRRTLDLRAG